MRIHFCDRVKRRGGMRVRREERTERGNVEVYVGGGDKKEEEEKGEIGGRKDEKESCFCFLGNCHFSLNFDSAKKLIGE